MPRPSSFASSLVLLATILSSAAEARHGTQFIGSMEFGGQERHWLVRVPASYDGLRAVPLVVRLHAAGGHFNSTEEHGWFDVSDAAGFIVVLPNGSLPSGTGGGLKWNIYSWTEGPDDVGFLVAVIERVRQQLRVDARRIYMTGHSNGASMTNTFAFAHADLLAAIAPAQGAWITALGLDPLAVAPQPAVPLPVWIWRGETENELVGAQPRNVQDQLAEAVLELARRVPRSAREPRRERRGIHVRDRGVRRLPRRGAFHRGRRQGARVRARVQREDLERVLRPAGPAADRPLAPPPPGARPARRPGPPVPLDPGGGRKACPSTASGWVGA